MKRHTFTMIAACAAFCGAISMGLFSKSITAVLVGTPAKAPVVEAVELAGHAPHASRVDAIVRERSKLGVTTMFAELESAVSVRNSKMAGLTEPSQRDIETAGDLVADLNALEQERLLALLNQGSIQELSRIHGIGEKRAAAIVEARPLAAITELSRVQGVGSVTYRRVIEFGKLLDGRTNDLVASVDRDAIRGGMRL